MILPCDNPAFGNLFPSTGAGDITWALEWDFVGSVGPRTATPPLQTAVITKHLEYMIIPEPAIASILIGFASLGFIRCGRCS